jgi:5-formyltetrahydrofolate cyclo-ligase
MPEILDTRRSIRAEKLQQRESLAEEVRQNASVAITSRILSLVEAEGWTTLHCYLAFRSEVTTGVLIEQLLEKGIKVIVPWVESDGELSHHQLLGLDGLSEGPYGLPHPARNEFLELDSVNAVLLPLSAFDRSGNRLGYGKGFYDRFLAKLPRSTRRIGLAFAIQEADEIPAMDHDQTLHMIVTEDEIITAPYAA